MARPRALFVDAGGTLFRESSSRAEIYRSTAAELGLRADEGEVARAMAEVHAGLPLEIEGAYRYSRAWFTVYIQEVFARLGFGGDLGRLTRDLFAAFDDPRSFRVFDEVRPVLKRVKGAGIPIGVISNWSPRLSPLLARLGLLKDFQVVVASAVVRMEKPDPAIFRRAADELGVPVAECVHIGDQPMNDADGANRAGMRGVLLDRDQVHLDHADRADGLDRVLELFGLPSTRTNGSS